MLVFGGVYEEFPKRCPGISPNPQLFQRGGKERGPKIFSTDIVCVFGVARLQFGLDVFGEVVALERNFE